MKDEALRLALKALEKLDRVMKRSPDTDKAITAIKQALEQPEPEPRVWSGVDFDIKTSPPKREWQGLTADEIVMIGVATGMEHTAIHMIENKLKEKNT